MREVKLSRLETLLEDLDYPVSREEAAVECHDVSLVLADGQASVPDLLDRSNAGSFASMDELSNELMTLLPRRAVGEPYQSEGEG